MQILFLDENQNYNKNFFTPLILTELYFEFNFSEKKSYNLSSLKILKNKIFKITIRTFCLHSFSLNYFLSVISEKKKCSNSSSQKFLKNQKNEITIRTFCLYSFSLKYFLSLFLVEEKTSNLLSLKF